MCSCCIVTRLIIFRFVSNSHIRDSSFYWVHTRLAFCLTNIRLASNTCKYPCRLRVFNISCNVLVFFIDIQIYQCNRRRLFIGRCQYAMYAEITSVNHLFLYQTNLIHEFSLKFINYSHLFAIYSRILLKLIPYFLIAYINK